MPTGVIPALTDFIYRKAKEFNCYEDLMDLIRTRQFDNTCKALKHMGWLQTGIALPEDSFHLPIHETVFRFDNQKFGYLCFMGKRNSKSGSPQSGDSSTNHFKERNDTVVNYLKNLERHPYDVLSLFVISETGEDILFAWPKSPDGQYSLSLTYSELDAIAYSENINGLTLWKFAKTYNKSNELFRINSMGGTLDAYVAYLETKGCFHHSEEKNPLGGTVSIAVGFSNDFLRERQIRRDEHAVSIFYKRRRAYTKVVRYKDYAPIYVEKEAIIEDQEKVFRLVIETYKMPIWIINRYSKKDEKQALPRILCEGVAFWLHKMKEYLQPVLENLTYI